MRRRSAGSAIFILIAIFLMILPIWQLKDWAETKREKGDAVELLYQVSAFQMEWMGSYLTSAGALKDTDQLNALKQAAYSAGYTHERLAEAVGAGMLPKLESVKALLDFILRLQLGGNRPLKADETQALKETAEIYKELFEGYDELLSSDGVPIKSQNSKVADADEEIAELLRKKLK